MGLEEAGEVDFAHVATLLIGLMKGEGGTEIVGHVTGSGYFKVIPHYLFVVGMHAVLNDVNGALFRVFSS